MLSSRFVRDLSARRPLCHVSKSPVSKATAPARRRVTVFANQPENPIVIYDLGPAPGRCPYAQRGRITLLEKGINHKLELIDGQNKPQEFLDLFRSITSDPKGRGTVPTIIDGDVKLTESHIVAEYLDNAYPNAGMRIFPANAKKLAQVRLFVELFANNLLSNGFKVLTSDTRENLDAAKEGFTYGLTVIDSFLRDHGLDGGDFLLGEEFSYAEVATLPFMYRFHIALPQYRDIDPLGIVAMNKLDHLNRWIKAGFGRPSLKATMADDETIRESWGNFVKPIKD